MRNSISFGIVFRIILYLKSISVVCHEPCLELPVQVGHGEQRQLTWSKPSRAQVSDGISNDV
jgi:hypothetical protein